MKLVEGLLEKLKAPEPGQPTHRPVERQLQYLAQQLAGAKESELALRIYRRLLEVSSAPQHYANQIVQLLERQGKRREAAEVLLSIPELVRKSGAPASGRYHNLFSRIPAHCKAEDDHEAILEKTVELADGEKDPWLRSEYWLLAGDLYRMAGGIDRARRSYLAAFECFVPGAEGVGAFPFAALDVVARKHRAEKELKEAMPRLIRAAEAWARKKTRNYDPGPAARSDILMRVGALWYETGSRERAVKAYLDSFTVYPPKAQGFPRRACDRARGALGRHPLLDALPELAAAVAKWLAAAPAGSTERRNILATLASLERMIGRPARSDELLLTALKEIPAESAGEAKVLLANFSGKAPLAAVEREVERLIAGTRDESGRYNLRWWLIKLCQRLNDPARADKHLLAALKEIHEVGSGDGARTLLGQIGGKASLDAVEREVERLIAGTKRAQTRLILRWAMADLCSRRRATERRRKVLRKLIAETPDEMVDVSSFYRALGALVTLGDRTAADGVKEIRARAERAKLSPLKLSQALHGYWRNLPGLPESLVRRLDAIDLLLPKKGAPGTAEIQWAVQTFVHELERTVRPDTLTDEETERCVRLWGRLFTATADGAGGVRRHSGGKQIHPGWLIVCLWPTNMEKAVREEYGRLIRESSDPRLLTQAMNNWQHYYISPLRTRLARSGWRNRPKNVRQWMLNRHLLRFHDGAAAAGERLLELEIGEKSGVMRRLIAIYSNNGQHGNIERAIELQEELIEAHPGQLPDLKRLGQLYQQAGRDALAAKIWLRAALAESHRNVEFMRQIAWSLSNSNRHKEAIRAIDRALGIVREGKSETQLIFFLYERGRLLNGAARKDEALVAFEESLELAIARKDYAGMTYTVAVEATNLLSNKRRYDEAAEIAGRLIDLLLLSDRSGQLAEMRRRYIRYLAQSPKRAEHIAAARREVRENPDSYRAAWTLSRLLEQTGDTAAAAEAYGILVAVAPNDMEARKKEVDLLVRAKERGKAIERLWELARIDLSTTSHFNRLAQLYRQDGDRKMAERALTTMVEFTPRDADSHLAYARALAGQRDLFRAEREFRLAAKLRPGNPQYFYALAEAWQNSGKPERYERAMKVYREMRGMKWLPRFGNVNSAIGSRQQSLEKARQREREREKLRRRPPTRRRRGRTRARPRQPARPPTPEPTPAEVF